MPMIKIDDKEYDYDSLSDNLKQQVQMLQLVEAELNRNASQTAILQTARNAYTRALREGLNPPPVALAGETIRFS